MDIEVEQRLKDLEERVDAIAIDLLDMFPQANSDSIAELQDQLLCTIKVVNRLAAKVRGTHD
jgi:hypothetical protein